MIRLVTESEFNAEIQAREQAISTLTQEVESKSDVESPDFTGTPTVNGKEIAVKEDINNESLNIVDKVLTKKPLSGKTIFCLGDSFTEINIYQQYLIELGATVLSNGIGGSCITGGTNYAQGDGVNRIPFVDRIQDAIDQNTDYLIIEGGSNDWYYSAALGTITDTVTTTYYGALNRIASICAATKTKVIPVNLLQRNGAPKAGGASGRANYTSQNNYANAMISVFQQYGIETLDMFHNSGINFENIQFYTYDGCHPSTPAGKEIYGKRIANFILTKNELVEKFTDNKLFIEWTNLFNCTFENRTLSASENGQWNATAKSHLNIGYHNSDGYIGEIECFLEKADGSIIGLSTSDNATTGTILYRDFKWAVYANANVCRVFELGVQKFEMNINTAPRITIKVKPALVDYYVNGVLVYTSAIAPSFPLRGVACLSVTNVSLSNATIKGINLV